MAEVSNSMPVIALTAVVGAVVLVFIFLCNFIKSKGAQNDDEKVDEIPEKNGIQESTGPKKKEKVVVKKRESRTAFAHPWLACHLKAHSGPVLGLDFSPNGKYLATCSEDRTVHIWSVKDFNKKEHKSVRANVELDHATRVRFSPDSRAFVTSLFSAETLRVFRIGKKEDGGIGAIQGTFDFPQKHSADIINIGIASSGKFIMTCYSDTIIKIWDIKGELLSTIDTRQVNNAYGCVSPCGRFVASSGFTPDVKVWEVCFDKGGTFQDVKRAFELKGHSAGIQWFSFSSDSRRMASISKDGTWRFWDTNVEYKKNQDPYLLRTWKYNCLGPTLITLSPDARTVALATGTNISLYSVTSDESDTTLEEVFNGSITAMDFSIDSRYLAISGDKQVSVFHNVTGYQSTINELEEKKKAAGTAAMRERLQQQIDEARALLKSALDGKS